MTKEEIAALIAQVVQGELAGRAGLPVPAEVSGRHVHLTVQDVEALFGAGHTLTPKRPLSQPGQFLCEERLTILTSAGELKNVAILGPARAHTQVELSLTDARALHLDAPVRLSGHLEGAADVYLLSPSALLRAKGAAIVAQNHVHMTPADAAHYGVRDGQKVRIEMEGGRPLTFRDVVVRVSENAALAFHIDPDEANSCAFSKASVARLCPEGGIAGCSTGTAAAPSAAPVCPAQTAAAPAALPEGRLITEAAARQLVAAAHGPVVLPQGALLTPLARDVLKTARRLEHWGEDFAV